MRAKGGINVMAISQGDTSRRLLDKVDQNTES